LKIKTKRYLTPDPHHPHTTPAPSPLRRQGPSFLDLFSGSGSFGDMGDEKYPAVYITANRYRGTIYVGVTGALWNRIANHKNKAFDGFTSEYEVHHLVWYEHHHQMEDAIRREKQLKKWKRDWKIRMIEEMNPNWLDLHDVIDTTATLVVPKAGPLPSQG
jgi:putative endonuclease